MFSINIPTIIIGILSVIAFAALLTIILRRRNQSKLENSSMSSDEISSVTESGIPTETSNQPADLRPSNVSRSTRSVSWENKSLFAANTFRRESDDTDPLPTIEPDEIPNLDSSDYVLGSVTPILSELLPESPERRDQTKKELQNAGFYQPHALQNLAALRYLAIILPLLFFGFLLVIVPPQFEMIVLGCLVIVPMVGWALPRLYITSKGRDRQLEIERAMPDLLDMLNMCISQGLTIQNALKRVTPDLKPIYPDLVKELNIVNDQANLGSLKVALENFSNRVDVPDVHSFTSLIVQTEQMGTSISAALAEYSDTMRESLRQRADQKANQASFKLLFPTVLCLMPAVYIFLLSPAIIEVTRFFNDGGRDALDRGQQAVQQLNE